MLRMPLTVWMVTRLQHLRRDSRDEFPWRYTINHGSLFWHTKQCIENFDFFYLTCFPLSYGQTGWFQHKLVRILHVVPALYENNSDDAKQQKWKLDLELWLKHSHKVLELNSSVTQTLAITSKCQWLSHITSEKLSISQKHNVDAIAHIASTRATVRSFPADDEIEFICT